MGRKEQSQFDVLKKYLGLLFSYHNLITLSILLAISGGIYLYLQQPKLYRSSASIIFQEQRINPSSMAPDTKMQMREMVNTVSQQVMSRRNLEDLLERFDLYGKMRDERPIEEVIERFRKNIEVTTDRDRGNVFAVSFQGLDPVQVKDITDAIAAKFIDENLRFRKDRARETAAYIQDELEMAKKRLNKKEAQMRDYRLKYYNEMPDQRRSNMNRLNSLQEQYNNLQTRIYNLEQTRMLIADQLEVRRKLEQDAAAASAAGSGRESGGPAQELADARNQLQDLLSRYTPEHPEVKRMERRIERLEYELKQLQEKAPSDVSSTNNNDAILSMRDPRIGELVTRLREIDVNLKTLSKEAENIRQQMQKYQAWIDAAPVREAEWAALTRDYEELKQYHDELLSRSLAAEAAESLEVRQKGSQFKIVDPAFIPKVPQKGSFFKILLASLLAGLAVGGGAVVGLDRMDNSFKDEKEIEDYLELPVACALPLILTDTEKRRARIKNFLWSSIFTVWLIGLITATVYFWQEGEIFI